MERQILQLNEELREKNLSCYESLYHHRPQTDPEENEKYRMVLSSSGMPSLAVKQITPEDILSIGTDEDTERDHADSSSWLQYSSIYDPVYEAQRWAESVEMDNRRSVFAVLGFGAGYQLCALMDKLRPDTTFFVFEPDDGLLSFVCGFMDLTELFRTERIFIFTGSYDEGAYLHYLERAVFGICSQAYALSLPLYAPDERFDEACRQIRLWARSNALFQKTRGRMSLRNHIHTWTVLHRNRLVEDLVKKLPDDLPVIIVAGGPSLNKNVEDLKKAKNRALIICIDRAVSTLSAHDIRPDLLITIDPEKNPAYLDDEKLRDIPLISAFQTKKESQQLFDGRIFYFIAGPYESKLPELADRLLPMGNYGGNVASAAYTLFALYRMKNVILVGQDLANLGIRTHADGSDDGAYLDAHVIEAEGVNGGTVQTNGAWLAFRDFYEQMILSCPWTTCIDATEGGVLIHGSKVMTLQQAIDEICTKEYDIQAFLQDIPYAQTAEGHAETIKIMEQWMADLDEMSDISKELLTYCSQLLKICRYHDIADTANVRKLNKLDELRAKLIYKDIYNVMTQMWVEDVDSVPDITFVVRNNEEAIPVFEKAIAFYEQFPEDCRTLREAIAAELG